MGRASHQVHRRGHEQATERRAPRPRRCRPGGPGDDLLAGVWAHQAAFVALLRTRGGMSGPSRRRRGTACAMSDVGAGSWPDRLRAARPRSGGTSSDEIVDQYVRHLRSTEDLVPQREASEMLGLLRGVRRYAELHAVADALLGHGLNDAVVKRQFAQALVDRDSPAAALLVYQGILDDPSTPEEERPEAMGGDRALLQAALRPGPGESPATSAPAGRAGRVPRGVRRGPSPLLARDQHRRAAGPSRPGLGRGRGCGRRGGGVAHESPKRCSTSS